MWEACARDRLRTNRLMAVSPAVVVSGPWSAGFVGRVDEVAVLRDLVGEVAAGRGGSVLVEGEPGIGKSALLAVGLSDVVELGCRVFRCTGDVSGERLPLRALLRGAMVQLRPRSSPPSTSSSPRPAARRSR